LLILGIYFKDMVLKDTLKNLSVFLFVFINLKLCKVEK